MSICVLATTVATMILGYLYARQELQKALHSLGSLEND